MAQNFKPFVGIFGSCDEAEILEHIIPLEDVEITIPDIINDTGITKIKTNKIIKRLTTYNILKEKKRGEDIYYLLNTDSILFKALKVIQLETTEIYLRDELV
jgi:hypothetical protein